MLADKEAALTKKKGKENTLIASRQARIKRVAAVEDKMVVDEDGYVSDSEGEDDELSPRPLKRRMRLNQ